MVLTYTVVYGTVVITTVSVGYFGTKLADKFLRKQKRKKTNGSSESTKE